MILPQIIYNAVTPVTLAFSIPNYLKPKLDPMEATRTDTDSYDGHRQTVHFRTDVFKTLQMDFVPDADMANWKLFYDWALTGKVFTFYPDATVAGVHTDFTLQDKKWTPVRVPKSIYNKWTSIFRQYVA